MASLKVTCERMEFNNFYQEIQHFAHIQGILINLPEVNLLCHKIANHSLLDMTHDSQEEDVAEGRVNFEAVPVNVQ